jgi:hypothetical protein
MALTGVVALMVALPLAVASAGPVGDEGPEAARTSDETVHSSEARTSGRVDGRAPEPSSTPSTPSTSAKSPLLLGLGLATAARCGPELGSPHGIEAQTCVLTQGRDTWARTYYRNAIGDDLTSVLTLMGPGGRTVQMYCAVGAEGEPGACETPRERTAGDARAYTAVAEFAKGADGPLLLRSGSNSPAQTAS